MELKLVNKADGNILIKDVPVGAEKIEVELRPITWDDDLYFKKMNLNEKESIASAYVRLIVRWSSDEPLTSLTLIQDKFYLFCKVLERAIQEKFFLRIEFSESDE